MAQKSVFRDVATDVLLIKQGAEARIYTCLYQGRPAIIKERFTKSYRHPALDRTLTVRRTRAEAKCIQRCQNVGIRCPEVYFVDSKANVIYMEHISDSVTVKDHLTQQLTHSALGGDSETPASVSSLLPLGKEIGRVLGTMHRNHVIHGDLTTSNMLLVGPIEDLKIALIDFGLGSYSESVEDKGVDLYVLERALLSTHPNTESLFEAILSSYVEAYEFNLDQSSSGANGQKNSKKLSAELVLKKFDEVRQRGRKRTMVG